MPKRSGLKKLIFDDDFMTEAWKFGCVDLLQPTSANGSSCSPSLAQKKSSLTRLSGALGLQSLNYHPVIRRVSRLAKFSGPQSNISVTRGNGSKSLTTLKIHLEIVASCVDLSCPKLGLTWDQQLWLVFTEIKNKKIRNKSLMIMFGANVEC